MLNQDYLGKWVSKTESLNGDGEGTIKIIDVVEVEGDFVICPNNITMTKAELLEKYEKPNLSEIDPFMSSGLQAMKTKEFTTDDNKVSQTQPKGVADYSDFVKKDETEYDSYSTNREEIKNTFVREKLTNEDLIMSMVDRIKMNKNLNKTSIETTLEFGISIDDLINSCSLLGLEKSEVLEVLKLNIDSIISIETVRQNIVDKVSFMYNLKDVFKPLFDETIQYSEEVSDEIVNDEIETHELGDISSAFFQKS